MALRPQVPRSLAYTWPSHHLLLEPPRPYENGRARPGLPQDLSGLGHRRPQVVGVLLQGSALPTVHTGVRGPQRTHMRSPTLSQTSPSLI